MIIAPISFTSTAMILYGKLRGLEGGTRGCFCCDLDLEGGGDSEGVGDEEAGGEIRKGDSEGRGRLRKGETRKGESWNRGRLGKGEDSEGENQKAGDSEGEGLGSGKTR